MHEMGSANNVNLGEHPHRRRHLSVLTLVPRLATTSRLSTRAAPGPGEGPLPSSPRPLSSQRSLPATNSEHLFSELLTKNFCPIRQLVAFLLLLTFCDCITYVTKLTSLYFLISNFFKARTSTFLGMPKNLVEKQRFLRSRNFIIRLKQSIWSANRWR